MHFQLIKDDFYNNILGKIEYYFSSFYSVFDKEDGIYPILGELGSFILNNFHRKEIEKATIAFINEAIELGGSETQDVMILQLFQQFYKNKYITDDIRKGLKSKSLALFDKSFEEYKSFYNLNQ